MILGYHEAFSRHLFARCFFLLLEKSIQIGIMSSSSSFAKYLTENAPKFGQLPPLIVYHVTIVVCQLFLRDLVFSATPEQRLLYQFSVIRTQQLTDANCSAAKVASLPF